MTGTPKTEVTETAPPRFGRKAPIYRPDLDGLRGVAIAFVVVFHVWLGRVSGGVDVFLALSGFFFLGSLVRNATRDGSSLSPVPTLWRLVRRLWPVLAVVVAATVGLTMALRPQPLWDQVFSQARSSLLYYQNWELARTSQDYAAADASISPLQHLWSMSVQGQFYLLALALVLGVAAAFRLVRRTPSRWLYAALFAATVVLSLRHAVHGHVVSQPWNYYDTFARLWELFLGGLCAVVIGGIAFPWLVRFVATVAGMAMVLSCGLLLDGAGLFPSWWALYPVGGAMLIVIFGAVPEGTPVRWWSEPVTWLLSTRPARRLGDLAYGLYLWHWPLLILMLAVSKQPHASKSAGLALIMVSLGLAWLTERLIERPLRMRSRVQRTASAPAAASQEPAPASGSEPEETAAADAPEATAAAEQPEAPKRRVPVGVAAALVVVILSGGFVFGMQTYWSATSVQRSTIAVSDATEDAAHPGALAFLEGRVPEGGDYFPSPVQVGYDLPASTTDGCISDFDNTEVITCVYGDASAERTIALVGGSHSEHWLTAFDDIGRIHGFRIVTVLKMGCPLTLDGTVAEDKAELYAGCTEWSLKALDTILGLKPEYVATTATRPAGQAQPDYTPQQYVDLWAFLAEHGIDTLAIRDTPWIEHGDGPVRAGECLADSGGTPIRCGMPRDASMAPENPAVLAAAGLPSVKLLDFTDALCGPVYCPAVIGNVIAYHDSHHLSGTFVRSMRTEIERQLSDATHWW